MCGGLSSIHFNRTTLELLTKKNNNMRVLRINKDLGYELAIVKKDSIEEIELSEAYDQYGQQWGDEYKHFFVNAINYHDGSNWRTLFVGSNNVIEPDLDYLYKEQEKEILALFDEIENGDWEDCDWGRKSCKKGGYKFILSPGGKDSWNVVRVEEC